MPAINERSVSMRDVARVAGVSHQTVSRVINDSPSLRPETKARVLAAIEQLDYRPNALARALAIGRSQRIGLLMEASAHYGPMGTLRGLEGAARRAGYSSTLYNVTPGSAEDFSRGIDYLYNQGIEALAIIAPRTQSLEVLRGADLHLPTVVLGMPPVTGADPVEELGLSRVGVNQAAGARLAMRHLISGGHQVIAHLAGPTDWLDSQTRQAAWRASMAEAGLPEPPLLQGDWSADSGYAAADRALQIPGLTAVFVANDQMALGLIHGLTDHGCSVPREISIVGFDDLPDSGHYRPPLTTVHQDFEALGQAAVAALLSRLGGSAVTPPAWIDPHLVVRSSSVAV